MAVLLWLIIVFGASIEATNGGVYKVGDSAGWTTIGNVDYKQWALTKTFQLGDVIVFEYNPQFHNVMQVTHAEYRACNVSSPISTHTTGNDSITIDTRGHHFFLCGVPGHCQAGQKVDINVLPLSTSAPATPSGIFTPSPVPESAVPAPSPSGAPPLITKLELLLTISQLALVFLFRW
ncbi:hypothetical protein ABFS82_07G029800 [Erythranthe guttata]|uniref:Phytocyanin domain-containing protein n=1 Tax=Erythranthe guttata TaxID=4155 RepID=A0A022RN80_ERYGU|nr:PREDICTED: mavicyanin [Erythranthe guttata]EYU41504.1 hypothetical protein MIMGU_mgv1a014825mg [Erythranthe guttata]|eukprot:XP_012832375.1 PREDICTED: mavicyanin [Erythranthe guttata]